MGLPPLGGVLLTTLPSISHAFGLVTKGPWEIGPYLAGGWVIPFLYQLSGSVPGE